MEEMHDKKEEADKAQGRRRLLSIFKESWRDDYRFFSVRDLELCIKGLCEGTYMMAELEIGEDVLGVLPGGNQGTELILRLQREEKNGFRILERTVIPSEAQSLLIQALESGLPKGQSGWKDITDTMKV